MNPPDAAASKTLTLERWHRIETIFHAALEIPEAARAGFLRESCGGDESLLAELNRVIYAFENGTQFKPSDAATAHLEPRGRLGEIVGGYRLDAELGHGGMGTVYLASRVDGEFEQQVALKVVSAHLRTHFFAERFRAERQILANLNHPKIGRAHV